MQKQGVDAKGYQNFYKLLFCVFYLDHSQNEWLKNYFTELLGNIKHLKFSLDIVHQFLNNAEITAQAVINADEQEADPYADPFGSPAKVNHVGQDEDHSAGELGMDNSNDFSDDDEDDY